MVTPAYAASLLLGASLFLAACCGGPGARVDFARDAHGRATVRVQDTSTVDELHDALQAALGRAHADYGDCVLVVRPWEPARPARVHLVAPSVELGASAYCGIHADPVLARAARDPVYFLPAAGPIVWTTEPASWRDASESPAPLPREQAFARARERRAARPGTTFIVEAESFGNAYDVLRHVQELSAAVGPVVFYVVDGPDPSIWLEGHR